MSGLNIGYKIILVVLIVTIPFFLIVNYDPFADRLGICNEDICPNNFKIAPEKCFNKEVDTCVFTTDSTSGVAVQEGTDNWQVYAKGLICERGITIYSEPKLSLYNQDTVRETCSDNGFFDKSVWTLAVTHSDDISGKSITVYTFDKKI